MPLRAERIPVERIVSGGQTGVDRAALDVALEMGIPCGGWCPRGRRAEDGPLDPRYPLMETPSRQYAQRTAWNVRDSDATLVLTVGPLTGGTALTVASARKRRRPCLVVDLTSEYDVGEVVSWLKAHAVRALNVAGPRESLQPGIARLAADFLKRLLAHR